MIARKIAEFMLRKNQPNGNYKSICILPRLRQIVSIVLRYSDTPKTSLCEIGLIYEKKHLQIRTKDIAKLLFIPQRVLLDNLIREGLTEVPTKQNDTYFDIKCYQLPESQDAYKLIQMFDNSKFNIENQFLKKLDKKREQKPHKFVINDNKKCSIKLPQSFTFTTEFKKKESHEPNSEFLNIGPQTFFYEKLPKYPEYDVPQDNSTVLIIDPTSTWMSTLEVRSENELILPGIIQGPISI